MSRLFSGFLSFMSEYLLINILVILVPLLLSFEKNITFYNKITYYLFSIAIVSTAFIIWDVAATKRGDWSFNPDYLNGIYFFGLPIEEILFFITVPFSTIFIYETVSFYIKDKRLKLNKHYFLIPFVLLLINVYRIIIHSFVFLDFFIL